VAVLTPNNSLHRSVGQVPLKVGREIVA